MYADSDYGYHVRIQVSYRAWSHPCHTERTGCGITWFTQQLTTSTLSTHLMDSDVLVRDSSSRLVGPSSAGGITGVDAVVVVVLSTTASVGRAKKKIE